jgi:D-3-phosphoglycerate dehydrogenase
MKVLVSDPIAEQGIEILKNAGFEVVQKTGLSPEELAKVIPDFDGIIIRSATKVTKEVIDAANNLKVIGRAGIGLDNVDRDAAKEKGVKVVNTPTATSISVAELALGIIGIGRIGSEMAKRAKALGIEVIAYDPYVKTSDYANIVDLDTLLKESDYISLHIPKTSETEHILNKTAFDKMKEGVVIINCARGGVVDENALYDAINDGKVRIACVDVFESEPAKDNKLFDLEQVIVTPHIGAQTKEGQTRAGTQVAELVRDALK